MITRLPVVAQLREFLQSEYVYLLGSGTSGLITALEAVHLPRGAEVLVPAMTCRVVH